MLAYSSLGIADTNRYIKNYETVLMGMLKMRLIREVLMKRQVRDFELTRRGCGTCQWCKINP